MKKMILAMLVAFFATGFFGTNVAVFETTVAEAASSKAKKRANRICRKQYGKRFVRSKISRSGTITCYYRPVGVPPLPKVKDYQTVYEWCVKRYSHAAHVQVRKRNGKWVCFTYE